MGIVFFLIGLPEFKKSPKLTKEAVKSITYIFATLLILLIFVVIISLNIHASGDLFLTGPLTPQMKFLWGQKVLTLGLLEGLWAVISLKWLLPIFFDPLDLSKKQILVLGCGIVFSVGSGFYAMLEAS
ncbi:hypothetical protein HPL003_06835 [Paenibacillus terrae HPL-003]|uniref:Uncharacterized protein n=1 Tax=Paenibacillus terrae (strain HPL-003) TaxID=985665 RepID=G7W3P3_PAETH|nr:hypothetical protein [Paenibacillus terrae]AET58130.1 hypothetical protein HPL003_06835 [Paenibacillus terrae HPL-003]